MGEAEVRYKCSLSVGLGACVEAQAPQMQIPSQLADLGFECGEHHGLQEFKGEASDGGHWARFRYRCCFMDSSPLTAVPLRASLSDTAEVWEGIYCPVKWKNPKDGISGRLDYRQIWNFRGGYPSVPIPELKFNTNTGLWCSGAPVDSCAEGPLVDPLDAKLSTTAWAVRPITDFGAEGAKMPKGEKKKPRKPPPTLSGYTAPDPESEYAEECKEDMNPAAETFNRDKMV